MQTRLTELRAALAQAQNELIEAEAALADRLAEIHAFEFEFEARVGHLIDTWQDIQADIQWYSERLQALRNKEVFGYAYYSAETQYRRTWQPPPPSAPTPPPEPLNPADEAEIKRLYRRLARRFHPDLAVNETDRARRTEKMTAVNDAYAARSLAELVALSQEPDTVIDTGRFDSGQTEAYMIQALEAELARCRRRLQEIEQEQRSLRHRPSLDLSLEVKAARRQGRNLLAEMAAELKAKIEKGKVERDLLKAQFDQLGPEQGVIRIKR